MRRTGSLVEDPGSALRAFRPRHRIHGQRPQEQDASTKRHRDPSHVRVRPFDDVPVLRRESDDREDAKGGSARRLRRDDSIKAAEPGAISGEGQRAMYSSAPTARRDPDRLLAEYRAAAREVQFNPHEEIHHELGPH